MYIAILVVGYIASILTTIGYMPQTIQTLRTKETQGVSILMFLIITFGATFWVIYGCMLISSAVADNAGVIVYLGDAPIMVANFFIGIMTIMVFRIKYKNIRSGKDTGWTSKSKKQGLVQCASNVRFIPNDVTQRIDIDQIRK